MIYAHLPYKVEVYKKTRTINSGGQPVDNWTLDRTIKCDFMSSRGEERLVQRQQNPQSYLIWTSDISIDQKNQLRNLKDRYGSIIDAGPFNVIGIRRHRGFAKVSHLTLNLQKVLS